MTSDSASDSPASRLDSVVRDYPLKSSRKFQKLLPLKAGIAELRKRHASYQTISDILQSLGISVAGDTVFRFCHEILGEPKARYRRRRKTSTLRVRKQPRKESVTPPALRFAGPRQQADRRTEATGPRIANPNTI